MAGCFTGRQFDDRPLILVSQREQFGQLLPLLRALGDLGTRHDLLPCHAYLPVTQPWPSLRFLRRLLPERLATVSNVGNGK